MGFVILVLFLAALAIWIYWDNNAIQTTSFCIGSEKIPGAFNGFVIVQVSDLHNAEFGDDQKTLLQKVISASPDLIAVTGDLVDSRHTNIEKTMKFIDGAVKIAPVYYVTGNHEARIGRYPILEQKLTAAGVTVLRNQAATLSRGKDSLRLLGLDDPSFAAKDRQTVDNALKTLTADGVDYTVLLSHRPELFAVYAGNGVDLVLSGHVHGGQVRLPFLGGLFAPNQGFFPKYQAGVYTKNQTNMVVSRGLGNSLAPIRIHNRPELAVITMKSSTP